MEGALPHRRRSEVFRNIDDSLKVMGLLSMKSLGLLFGLYLVSYTLDMTLGLWRLLFGRAGILVELAVFACAVLALSYAERQDDEHLVPAMLRYWLSGRSGVVYSGATPDGWPHHPLGRVLASRGGHETRPARAPAEGGQ